MEQFFDPKKNLFFVSKNAVFLHQKMPVLWSSKFRGMILALGARGRGFESPLAPFFLFIFFLSSLSKIKT